MLNIAVLISGSGSNLQSIIDKVEEGYINANIKVVISNKKDAYGLERAKKYNIKSFYETDEEKIINILKEEKVDFIVLAGFLKILSKKFISAYENKIINIHPSLIPSFCGKGYYGQTVHASVLEYGVKFTGATVHFVNENADTGPIIFQDIVKIEENDTVETLSKKVLEKEHMLLPKAIKFYTEGKLVISGRKVFINE